MVPSWSDSPLPSSDSPSPSSIHSFTPSPPMSRPPSARPKTSSGARPSTSRAGRGTIPINTDITPVSPIGRTEMNREEGTRSKIG